MTKGNIDLTYLSQRMDNETLSELVVCCDFIATTLQDTIAPVRAYLVNDLVQRLRADESLIPTGSQILVNVLVACVNDRELCSVLLDEINEIHDNSPLT